MTFAAVDICPLIGARVETDIATLVSGSRVADIRELLEQRGVLVFPKISLTDEDQLAFAHTLGDIIDIGDGGIYKVTLDPAITPSAVYLLGTFSWHFDGWADDVPARGSMLSARMLSKVGGQAEVANTYAAYEALSEDRKRAIEGLKAFHTMASTQRETYPNPTTEQMADWGRYPTKRHPLVWTHRSGRKSLLLGSSTDWIEGMDKGEGRALISELEAWATQPQFVYRHEWELGDMIIWDNCGAVHRVEPYPSDSGRLMPRVTLEGEEAIV